MQYLFLYGLGCCHYMWSNSYFGWWLLVSGLVLVWFIYVHSPKSQFIFRKYKNTLNYLYYLILLAFLLSERLSLRNSCLAKAGTVTPLLRDSFLLSLCLQIVMGKILFVGLKLEKGTIKVNCRWTTIYIDLFSEYELEFQDLQCDEKT